MLGSGNWSNILQLPRSKKMVAVEGEWYGGFNFAFDFLRAQ